MSRGRDPIASPPGNATLALLATADQRPQDAHRGAELAHCGEVRMILGLSGDVIRTVAPSSSTVAPQSAQHLRHQRDVEDVRAIREVLVPSAKSVAAISFRHTVLGSPDGNFAC